MPFPDKTELVRRVFISVYPHEQKYMHVNAYTREHWIQLPPLSQMESSEDELRCAA